MPISPGLECHLLKVKGVSCHGNHEDEHQDGGKKGGWKSAVKRILLMPCCWMPLILLALWILRR